MGHYYGWNQKHEDHAWLVRNQERFDRSLFKALKIPAEVDPRAYMSMRDQGQQGSCSGASRTALSERLNQIATGTTDQLLLSIQYAYDTNQKCCGCFGSDQGATIAGSVAAASKFGICHEALMPYTGNYNKVIPAQATAEALKHLVGSHSVISTFHNAIQYLGTAGVIQIGIAVGDAFENCTGVLTSDDVKADDSNPLGGHALAVIGYVEAATIGAPIGDGRAYLIGQNSWGDSWGAKGFFFIAADAFDFFCQRLSQGDTELAGMSKLTDFEDPNQAIDWNTVVV